jgi:hypothetical protein
VRRALGIRAVTGGALAVLAVSTFATWESPPGASTAGVEAVGVTSSSAPGAPAPAPSVGPGSFGSGGVDVPQASSLPSPPAVAEGVQPRIAAAAQGVVAASAGPTATGDELALVGPLLEMFAAGSGVGPGLVCGVVTGLVAQGIPDPAVASAAAQIVAICVDGGTQQAAAFRSVAEQLSALAALNPLANALIRQTAVFVRDLDPALPFPDLAVEIAALIDFFATDTPAG